MNKKVILLGAVGLALVAGAAIYKMDSKGGHTPLPDTSTLPQAQPQQATLPQENAIPATTAQITNVDELLAPTRFDRVLGDRNAPVTIIEYASMTCGHCGDFHSQTLPQIKENFIDTGKASLILRDMPWDNVAMAVSKLTRCVPGNRYWDAVDAFLGNQAQWLRAEQPLAELQRIGATVGLPAERFESCLNDQVLQQRIAQTQADARQTLNVDSTPTFFINGTRIEGHMPYADFVTAIEAALAEAGGAEAAGK